MIPNRKPVADASPTPGSRLSGSEFAGLVGDQLTVAWRLASFLSPDSTQAADLVERTAHQAFTRRSTLVSSIGFKPWFLGLLVELWQQQAGPRHLRLVDDRSDASPGDAYLRAQQSGLLEHDDPGAAILDRLDPDAVRDCLSRIPADDRLVLALSLADDLTYREIGLVLALSADTVRARLHRGRAVLKLAVLKATDYTDYTD
jgi:RNA polymerase sigma-70 factor (ECF subfamily)